MMDTGYNNSDEDDEDLGKSWQRRTVEIRSEAQRLLSSVGAAGVPNWRTIQLPKPSRQLHEAILGYADQIRPKAGKISGEEWELDTCLVRRECGETPKVPTSGEEAYDLGYTDMYGEIDRESLLGEAEWRPVPVVPASLNEKWRISNEVTIRGKARHKGRDVIQKETYRYYLPFAACVVLFCHLDECLDNLGWLPGGMKQMEGKVTADGDLELYGT